MNSIISQKINNFAYAPGIATYGGTGAVGKDGEKGNCIFFTSFNILGGEDLPEFKLAIQQLRLPIRDGQVITREYQNGDYFFDSTGAIFRMHDIDKLLSYPNLSDNYQIYFTLCGQIKSNNDANAIFSTTNDSNRITLNSYYKGVDINNTPNNIPDSENESYALRIFADNSNKESGVIEILHATPFYNYNITLTDFRIYYDPDNNIWHIDSEAPIAIDSEVKVNDNTDEFNSLTNYSSVITHKKPITNFYNYANNLYYKNNKNGTISLKVRDEKVALTYKNTDTTYVKFVTVIIDKDKVATNNTVIVKLQNLDKIKFSDLGTKSPDILTVSLINNIEIYIPNEADVITNPTVFPDDPDNENTGLDYERVADYVSLFDLNDPLEIPPVPTINNTATRVRIHN